MSLRERQVVNFQELNDLLHYFSVPELMDLCKKYDLPTHVPAPLLKKPALIASIITFVKTGKKTEFKVLLPSVSRAPKGSKKVLSPDARMLFGQYKNDLETRLFMQQLVGKHFHFTAYGHDWIKEKWALGKPPTYQQFATFWQHEHVDRKDQTTPLKQEWAYLKFLRQYKHDNPKASKQETLLAWETTRKEKVEEALMLLRKL